MSRAAVLDNFCMERVLTEPVFFDSGRYLIIAAIANQLRYPNSHTLWFSSFVLATFADTDDEAIREQIVRVILERIIVSRPHVFGILFVFGQLVSEPKYKLMERPFIQCEFPFENFPCEELNCWVLNFIRFGRDHESLLTSN